MINPVTGDVIAHMGKGFSPAGHRAFCSSVYKVVRDNHTPEQLEGMSVAFRSAHGGGWLRMDITLPNVTYDIVTNNGHKTKTGYRIIALHGVDGTCGNLIYFGAIDFFCTNGMIRGEHDKVRRKNSSLFSMERFIRDLRESTQSFYAQSERLQSWARKPLVYTDVRNMLHTLMKSERVGDKMLGLYAEEAKTRGHNAWALYSAFTNFSSHANDNGFQLRNTGKDTAAVSMFNREHTVSRWIDSKPFKELLAA